MHNAVAFTVPGDPVGKGRPRASTINGRPRLYTPAATVAYEHLVALAAQQAMAGAPPWDGPVRMELGIIHSVPASWSKRKQAAALLGTPRPTVKPDLDNVVKAIGDACNGILWRDDAQIVELEVVRHYGLSPCVRVRACVLAPID